MAAPTARSIRRRYADAEFAADGVAVLDAAGDGARRRRRHVDGRAATAFASPRTTRTASSGRDPRRPDRWTSTATVRRADDDPFEEPPHRRTRAGRRTTPHYWRRDWPGFAAFFVGRRSSHEPHSTKPIEDMVGWALETDPETMVATERAPYLGRRRRTRSDRGPSCSSAASAARPRDPRRPTTGSSGPRGRPARSPRLLGRAARRARGRRPRPARPRTGPGEPADPRLRRHSRETRDDDRPVRSRDATDDAGRARLPDRTGFATRERRRPASRSEAYGSGDPTIVLLPSAPIVHSRQWKAPGPVPQPLAGASSRSTAAATGGPTGRPTRRAYRDDRIVDGPRGGAWTRPATDAPSSSGCAATACGVDPVRRRRTRSACSGIVAFAVGVPRLSPPHPLRRGRCDVRRRAADRRGLGEDEPPLLACATTPASSRFFFDADHFRSPTRRRRSRTPSAWALDGSVDAMLAEARGRASRSTSTAVEAICRAVRCPMLLVHGTEDAASRSARASASPS